jgi:hypothetical protein
MAEESAIERWVTKHALEDYGVESTKFGYDGWPDRLFWVPAPLLLIEFKAPGEQPGPRQSYRINKLKRLGYDVEVHNNRESALEAIIKRVKRARHHARGTVQTATAEVGTARVPEEGGQVPHRARVRRPVP